MTTTNATATTIKVSSELRDRLNAEASRLGLTAAQTLESLLAERERAERFRAIKAARQAMPAAEREDYERESSEWERASLADLQ